MSRENDYFCMMIDLNRHIELLLLDNDCVILPGLGGFVVHNEPAKFDEDTEVFYPPFRSVGFNTQLNVNDGLLVQSVMQAYDTDYPTALQLCEDEIKRIKSDLQNQGTWHFGALGALCLNDEGIYEFKPVDESGIASPLLYGLDALSMTPYEETVTKQESVSVTVADNTLETLSEHEDDERYVEYPSFWQRNAKSALKYAAIFIGVFLLFFATSVPVKNVRMANVDPTHGALYSFPVKNAVQNVRKSFTKVTPVNAEKHADEVVGTPQTADPAGEVSHDSVTPESYYTIVLASRIKQSNAESYVASLSKKGFGKGEVMVKGKMTRVIYSRYKTENEAYNALRYMRNHSDSFEDAWVMHVAD